jgi:leucyl/phenylalanyl-tRNA--protein transferase
LESSKDSSFPHPDLAAEDGLLVLGGDLSPKRLIEAYAWTIFPWYSQGLPILWWSPDPRLVLFPASLHLPRSLRRTLNKDQFRLSLDQAFESVISGCAKAVRPEGPGTWLTPEMIEAYNRLHQLGYAHSVEAWQGKELVGGIYGVALGKVFYGESMFYKVSGASKVALVALVQALSQRGFTCLDCQQTTGHMQRFGAKEIPRHELLGLVRQGLRRWGPGPGKWQGRGLLYWDRQGKAFVPQAIQGTTARTD